MANDQSQEKTEEATPKKLREARKKGDVAKSKDLTMVVVMVAIFATVALMTGTIASEVELFMRKTFAMVSKDPLTGNDMWSLGKMGFFALVKILGPIFIAGMVAAIVANYLQVGAIFSTEPLKPKIEKLNPVEGFKNIFKAKTFIELIKNMFKLTVVIYLAYFTVDQFLQEILLSPRVNIIEGVMLAGEIITSFFIKVALIFLVISLLDMGIQQWDFAKRQRMTKDEVKREYKQDEGDPQIKGERRRIHREMVFGDAKQNVKKADAVVSNPTHVAVAIQYDREEMAAPEVLLKGQKKFAEMMLEIAREEGVPIVRNVPLAWALLQVEEGAGIPEDLYEPVAEVLAYVYELKEGLVAEGDEVVEDDDQPKTFDPLG
ncbi:MAG: type III secretion system export apparatus subunit SctU [Deltaproteobacteria bacterium]|nr:type III secretion system export apparatus subunit SctU [Deltaproteobacteria bacterium]